MKPHLFIILAFTWVFASCSTEDSSSIDESVPFYQNLRVEYHVDQNRTNVAANFNKKNIQGENIELTGSSFILFNREAPNFSTLGIYYYTYTFSHLEDVTFTFMRTSKQEYINTASLKEINAITIPEALISIDQKVTSTFTWTGNPVGVGEEVQVRIVTNNGEHNFYNSTPGSHSIEMTFSQTLAGNRATFYLNRIKTRSLKEEDAAGGQLKIAYVDSKEITLQ